MKTLLFLVLIVILSGFVVGQTKAKPKPTPIQDIISIPAEEAALAAGVFSGDRYDNPFLGFSIELPGGWTRLDDKTNEVALDKSKEIIKETQTKATGKGMDASISKTRILFQLLSDTPGGVIACGVERLEKAVTGRMYADYNLKLVQKTPGNTITKGIYSRSIGGRAWDAFEVEASSGGSSFRQLYLIRREGQVALFFVTTVGDEQYEPVVNASLNSIKFVK